MKKLLILLSLVITSQASFTQETKATKPYKGTYFMLATGIGSSYGGLIGLRAQGRYGKTQGIGAHLGYGYFSEGVTGTSVGVKFFPYKNIYLDIMYGFAGTYTESTSYITVKQELYAWYYSIGGDFVWGKGIGHGLNIGIGFGHIQNYHGYGGNLAYLLDLGYIIRF